MVYFKLEIVLGALLTFDDIKRIYGIDDPFDVCNIKLINDMKIFTFRCCSNCAGDLFVIGYTLHTYYRNYIRCDDCGEYNVCDRCIGHTNNGYYDVVTILNQPTEVDIRNVCLRCYADNKVDLGARQETCEIVGRNFVFKDEADRNHEGSKCKVCNLAPSGYRCPADMIKRENQYGNISKFLDKNNVESDIKLYYMIDDCLSCT